MDVLNRPTKWTILRYVGPCEDPHKAVLDMRTSETLPDEVRLLWDKDITLLIMELWYGTYEDVAVRVNEPRTIEQLMDQFHVHMG